MRKNIVKESNYPKVQLPDPSDLGAVACGLLDTPDLAAALRYIMKQHGFGPVKAANALGYPVDYVKSAFEGNRSALINVFISVMKELNYPVIFAIKQRVTKKSNPSSWLIKTRKKSISLTTLKYNRQRTVISLVAP